MATDPLHVAPSRAEEVAGRMRAQISNGHFRPGERLPEVELAAANDVSRNTLREAFRLLRQEGLITQIQNRGTFVATPSLASIIDIYRARRLIEGRAIELALPLHPAVERMRQAVNDAKAAISSNDWLRVGTLDLEFHSAIIELTDSPRLLQFFQHISAELRLAFGIIDDPQYLHATFHEENIALLSLVEGGRNAEAAELLDRYLTRAERMLLAAYEHPDRSVALPTA